MEKLRELAPDQLEIRSGGGCMSVFGLPFLVAGVFLTLVGFGVILPTNADEVPFWAWPVMVLMGLAFVAAGGGLAFGRSWKTIDRSRGVISVQWGLLVPMKVTEHGLLEYGSVVLNFVAGDSDSSERFPVVLHGNAPKSDLTLTSPTSYPVSREQAEKIAHFLRIPLIDRSTDHESVLEPEASRRSPGERTRNGPPSRESVQPPAVMRTVVQGTPESTVMTIPHQASRPAAVLRFVVPLVLAPLVLWNIIPFFGRTGTPAAVQLFFLGFASLFVLVPLARALYSLASAKMAATVVTTSSRGIRIEERRLRASRTTEIPADKILDIDYSTSDTMPGTARMRASGPGSTVPDTSGWTGVQPYVIPPWLQKLRKFFPAKGITIKARTGLFAFGAGLPDDEVRYLHFIVKEALAGESKRRDTADRHANSTSA